MPTAPASPTGDPDMDRLLPTAALLVGAAHLEDQLGIHAALADAAASVGDPLRAAHLLVVLLAAMCDDDTTPAELLAWRRNPVEYQRLRTVGVPSDQARALAGRVPARLERIA